MEDTENYVEKLRAVFDICDTENKGYITVDHFVSLALEHFEAECREDIDDIVNVLDSERDGRIYFHDFLQGVKQILELKGPASPLPLQPDRKFALYNIGSEETLVAVDEDANSCGTSEVSTFNEYDMMTDDDQQSNHDYMNGSSPDSMNQGLHLSGTLHGHMEDDRDSAIGGHRSREESEEEAEQFEDYGQRDESETDSPAVAHHHREHRLLTPGLDSYSRKFRHRRDWTRTRRMNGSNRRVVTPSALASHLYKATGSSAGTSRRSSCSDEIFDDIDGSFMELNEKVKTLESKVHILNDSQVKNEERQIRAKEENSMLIERIHTLEEQLRDVEVRSQEQIREEQRKHRDFVSRTDKDKSQEIEILQHRLQEIEKEYYILKEEAPRLRAEVDRLRRENQQLEEQLEEAQTNLAQLSDEQQELQDRSMDQRSQMDQEREISAQLMDELTKELEELRNYKLEAEQRGLVPAMSIPADITMLKKRDMEQQLVRLKMENGRLLEQNEDLQAQLLHRHLEEGHTLLAAGQGSLASEMENHTRDELLTAYKELQESNNKLRDYVDNLMLRIMDQNPSLLEVSKTTSPKTSPIKSFLAKIKPHSNNSSNSS